MKKGFSPIEVVVYIAILIGLAVVAVNTLVSIQKSLAQIRVARSLSSTEAVAMERVIRVIRDAGQVNDGASVFNSSPGTLSLTGSETPPVAYTVFVNNQVLMLQSGDGTIALTPPGIAVTNLVFRSVTASTTSQAVKVEMTLVASSGRATTSQNVYGTAVLRNSYK